MKNQILTKDNVCVDLSEEVARFGFKAGAVICGMIGVWAAGCLAVALVTAGPKEMITGYIRAIVGW